LQVALRRLSPGSGGRFRIHVDLAQGRNDLVIEAVDRSGNVARVERTVWRAPSWFTGLDPEQRPPLPLPDGVTFADEPGSYVVERDQSILRWVPPVGELHEGVFKMNSRAAMVRFETGFFLGKFEVTRAQYLRFCKETRRPPPRPPRTPFSADHPITNVSWHDAAAYCAWAGLRLPSEAEWEYGAVGTATHTYPWGEVADGNGRANLKEGEGGHSDGYVGTSPVGRFPLGVSPYGCLDMAGNAFEWVNDWYAPKKKSQVGWAEVDRRGPPSGTKRVSKGGGYDHPLSTARSKNRWGSDPDRIQEHKGFRVAR
jgi:hypothetical protein